MTAPDVLPGLEGPNVGKAPPTPLEQAIEATVEALRDQGHIAAADAGRVQLARELAEIIEVKKQTRRVSTVGNDARVLMELLDGLTKEAKDEDANLRDAMARWSSFLETGVDPGPGAADVLEDAAP